MAAVSQYEEWHRGIGGNPLCITRLWATMVYGLNARKFYLLKAVVYGLFAVACQPLAVVCTLKATAVFEP